MVSNIVTLWEREEEGTFLGSFSKVVPFIKEEWKRVKSRNIKKEDGGAKSGRSGARTQDLGFIRPTL